MSNWRDVVRVIVHRDSITLVLAENRNRTKSTHYTPKELSSELSPADWKAINRVQLPHHLKYVISIFRKRNNEPGSHKLLEELVSKQTDNLCHFDSHILNVHFKKAKLPFRVLVDPKKRYTNQIASWDRPYRIYRVLKM